MTVAATLGLREELIDLHALRQRRANGERVPFVDVDAFEGQPSDPMHLHKYAYGAGNPVSNIDPSGHDFTLVSTLASTGIRAFLTAGFGGGLAVGTYFKVTGGSFIQGALVGSVGFSSLVVAYYTKKLPEALAAGLVQGAFTVFGKLLSADASAKPYDGWKASRDFIEGAAYGAASNAYGNLVKVRVGEPYDDLVGPAVTASLSILKSTAQLWQNGQLSDGNAWADEVGKAVSSAFISFFINSSIKHTSFGSPEYLQKKADEFFIAGIKATFGALAGTGYKNLAKAILDS